MKILPNLSILDYRDFSFHNYGMIPMETGVESNNNIVSLDCSPDTDAAIQDALQEIIKDLHEDFGTGKRTIKDLDYTDKADKKIEELFKWISTRNLKETEYASYIKECIKEFTSEKHLETDKISEEVFDLFCIFNKSKKIESYKNLLAEFNTIFAKYQKKSGNGVDERLYRYLLVILRSIPQPWNNLGSGAIFKELAKKKMKRNQNIKQENGVIWIKDVTKCIEDDIPKEYKETVMYFQLFLEYALVFNTPHLWIKPGTEKKNGGKIPVIAVPLIDNGFFRGCYYLLYEKRYDEENKEYLSRFKKLFKTKQKRKKYKEKALQYISAIRAAYETEAIDNLLKEDDESLDIYQRLLKELALVQEVSFGSLWKKKKNEKKLVMEYVTGYGRYKRDERKRKDEETPGIYIQKEYKDYKNFLKRKRKNKGANGEINVEEKKLVRDAVEAFKLHKKKDLFYNIYPLIHYCEEGFKEKIGAKHKNSYYALDDLTICWRMILPVVKNDELKAIYFLYYRDPIWFDQSDPNDEKYVPLSDIYNGGEEKMEVKQIFGARARQIMKFFSVIDASAARKEAIMKHGSRAAMAAIMSRNMSHNIGSHVLSYWGNTLRNLIPLYEGNRSPRTELEHSEALFNYLKQRMDFIAEITTTIPSWEKTFSLEKDILDNFINQFAILDNIARSEGFCYASRCKKKIKSEDDRWDACMLDGDYCDRLPNKLKGLSSEKLKEIEPEPMEFKCEIPQDIRVSIPHGIIGKQAFFSILENFIRNSSKHGGQRIRKNIKKGLTDALKFTIHAEEDSLKYSEFIKITISDNVGNCGDFIGNERIIDCLKTALNDSEYVKKEDGRIKKGGWGIKEMKVSANFLRKREVDAIVNEKENVGNNILPILEANCIPQGEKNKKISKADQENISISLYLRKPKEVCIVSDDKNIKQNVKYGINIISTEKFKTTVENGESIPHRFLLIDGVNNEIEALIRIKKEQLPCRIIVNCNNKETELQKGKKQTDKWLDPVYGNVGLYEIIEYPEQFLLNLYTLFLASKINEIPVILMRNVTPNENWEVKNICTVSVPDDLKDLIVFDFHSEMINVDDSGCAGIPESIYYQGVSGGTSFGIFLQSVPQDEREKKLLVKELVESSMVKVLIADERIWENSQGTFIISKKDKSASIEKRKLLERMGIFLVPLDDKIIAEEEKSRLEKEKGEYKDIVFFVIHQGLLQKMKDPCFIGQVKKIFPYVIVDSGRGEPDKLEPGTKYVAMSAIESFIEEMDKYSLIQTLFSVRRTENAK